MNIYENGKRITRQQVTRKQTIVVGAISELSEALQVAGIEFSKEAIKESEYVQHYQIHAQYECFALRSPLHLETHAKADVIVVFNANSIVIVHADNASVYAMTKKLEENIIAHNVFSVLAALFEELLVTTDTIEEVEETLLSLEEVVMQDAPKECKNEIMQIRKQVLSLQRYYDGIQRILDILAENHNQFLTTKSLRVFDLYEKQVSHILENIRSVSEYATQVREAYQNQLDISLNRIMRVCTVITAVFLPLTLMVGWYGMNLPMPEYQWQYAYPVFIIISMVIVTILLWYLKKKKWF